MFRVRNAIARLPGVPAATFRRYDGKPLRTIDPQPKGSGSLALDFHVQESSVKTGAAGWQSGK